VKKWYRQKKKDKEVIASEAKKGEEVVSPEKKDKEVIASEVEEVILNDEVKLSDFLSSIATRYTKVCEKNSEGLVMLEKQGDSFVII